MTLGKATRPARCGQQGSAGISSPMVLPGDMHANAAHMDDELDIYLFQNLEPSNRPSTWEAYDFLSWRMKWLLFKHL